MVVYFGGDMVVIGGVDGNVCLYFILGIMLKDEGKFLEVKGFVIDVVYFYDGVFFVVCDVSKVVIVFSVVDGYLENNVFYGYYVKIVCLVWFLDNEYFVFGGMDMMVYVWILSDLEIRVKI